MEVLELACIVKLCKEENGKPSYWPWFHPMIKFCKQHPLIGGNPMMMQAQRRNNNLNIGNSDQLWHKMWKKMQHITLRTNYLQQQNPTKQKTYNSCRFVLQIHEHKKQERHTLEEKGCTQNSKKKIACKAPKIIQKHNEHAGTRARWKGYSSKHHTSCNVFENKKNIENN